MTAKTDMQFLKMFYIYTVSLQFLKRGLFRHGKCDMNPMMMVIIVNFASHMNKDAKLQTLGKEELISSSLTSMLSASRTQHYHPFIFITV